MNIAEFSIKHKYTIFALVIAVILSGVFSAKSLKVELMPDTNPPVVNVITAYPGVSAKDVVKEVSQPLEEEFATVEGVKKIKSTSQDGLSIVKVEFHYGQDTDVAAVDIQNAINRIRRQLPGEIQDPQVMKFSASDKPIITYALQSDKVSLSTIRDIADNELKAELQTVEGVSAVDVFGGYRGQVNIFVDKRRLDAYNIPLNKVVAAVRGQNASEPGGRITGDNQEYLIRLMQEYESLADIEKTVIANQKGNIIYLKDVAIVKDSGEEGRSEFRYNGEAAIALQVMKRDDANTVEVVENIEEQIKQLQKVYPHLQFNVANDDSDFTKQTVDNMSSTVGGAIILTTVIIFISIVSFSESVIISLSMPVSFLMTLTLMKLSDLELNLVTLSALILAVGMVIDNSIVVIENIVRHRQELDKDIKRAAIEGTQEVFLSVAAGTFTSVIVFVPLIFLEGFVGKVFGPLSLTLLYALLSSLVVSVVIVPLLMVFLGVRPFLGLEKIVGRISSPYLSFMEGLRDFYVGILSGALKRRLLAIAVAVVFFGGGILLFKNIGTEVLPKIDSGTFSVSIQTYPGTAFTKTSSIVAEVEKIIFSEKEVLNYSTQIGYEPGGHYLGSSGALGVTQGEITVNLSARNKRDETIWEIENRLRDKIARVPGIETFVVKEIGGTAISTTTAPIDIRISGNNSQQVFQLAEEVQATLVPVPGVVNLHKSWSLNSPEVHIKVDENRAAEYGLSPTEVISEVFGSLEGIPASEIKSDNRKDKRIVVRYRPEDRVSLADLENVTLTTQAGIRVPLRTLAEIEISKGANVATRENLQSTIDVLGYTHERTFSHVMDDINKALEKVEVPDGYSIDVTGEQSDLKDSMKDILFSLSLAIIGVYLLLLAQFRSFVHPVTIMLAIPLVFIGVALALLLTKKAVSMSALLGLILLVGTVVNNSIVLIDFTNQARTAGQPRYEALVETVKLRFRPIMMTATSTLVGMLPLATGFALGSERFAPLAITVIGGLTASTLLTMIIVPVFYSLFDDVASLFKTVDKGSC